MEFKPYKDFVSFRGPWNDPRLVGLVLKNFKKEEIGDPKVLSQVSSEQFLPPLLKGRLYGLPFNFDSPTLESETQYLLVCVPGKGFYIRVASEVSLEETPTFYFEDLREEALALHRDIAFLFLKVAAAKGYYQKNRDIKACYEGPISHFLRLCIEGADADHRITPIGDFLREILGERLGYKYVNESSDPAVGNSKLFDLLKGFSPDFKTLSDKLWSLDEYLAISLDLSDVASLFGRQFRYYGTCPLVYNDHGDFSGPVLSGESQLVSKEYLFAYANEVETVEEYRQILAETSDSHEDIVERILLTNFYFNYKEKDLQKGINNLEALAERDSKDIARIRRKLNRFNAIEDQCIIWDPFGPNIVKTYQTIIISPHILAFLIKKWST